MVFKIAHAPIFGALLACFAFSAHADTTSPAEVTFWQSVQNSKNPAEYRAYISAFPHGVFVEVANARIKEYSGAAGGQPANATPALAPVVGKAIITATPTAIEVGDQATLTFAKFPKANTYDWIVIDPAGTPDSASLSANVGGGGGYANTVLQNENGYKIGPFPPGSYEVRWLTILYNTKSLLQVGARAPFSVNP